MNEELIQSAIQYIIELFKDSDASHDAEHTLRVYRNAMLIAENEPGCDKEVVAVAALLHDADDHKLFPSTDLQNARAFLTEHGFPKDRTEDICEIIRSVSFSNNRDRRPRTPEGKIVQDADRLDAIGAVGVARTFAFGGERGRSLQDSVKHFHEKLLLLKDLMNTETGRQLAENRHAFLESFLAEYEEETR